jgi:predicted nucleic acid-binding protein
MFNQQLSGELADLVMGAAPCTTFVQLGELTSWAIARNWGTTRSQALTEWVNKFPVIDGDAAVAETWGEIVAYSRKRGRPKSANDSWIAACCIRHGLPLVTLNERDFADFAEFEGLELIS